MTILQWQTVFERARECQRMFAKKVLFHPIPFQVIRR